MDTTEKLILFTVIVIIILGVIFSGAGGDSYGGGIDNYDAAYDAMGI